jgi:transposase
LVLSLVAQCRFGHTKIDNNLVENAIRPSTLGKKNWLFIGRPEAGDRSAILYSIIASCRRYGISARCAHPVAFNDQPG